MSYFLLSNIANGTTKTENEPDSVETTYYNSGAVIKEDNGESKTLVAVKDFPEYVRKCFMKEGCMKEQFEVSRALSRSHPMRYLRLIGVWNLGFAK